MYNDILTNVILVNSLINSINSDIGDVKENLGLLIADRRGIDIYNDLGYVMRTLERIEETEIRIGLAAKDIQKELKENQDHN
jgi:hypothetical protein